MNLPKDPFLLLSVINTALRDKYTSFESLCDDIDFSSTSYSGSEDIKKALENVGFTYNPELNQFK